jgi:predicted SprT family Zn-dependent metalloprotease
VRREANAYLTLGECQELVDATIAFLRSEKLGRLPIADPGPVPLSWMKSTAKHGLCKSKPILPGQWAFSISFSKPVFEHTNLEGRVQTVIHEACHVIGTLLGDRGHGRAWQACMRTCGVPADVKAEALAALSVTMACPKCARVSSVSTATAGRIQKGVSRVVCPGCGGPLGAADLRIPESQARRVASAAAKKEDDYDCPCGAKIRISPRARKALSLGMKLTCSQCGKTVVR